jgi:hypothetical protein
VEHGLGGRLGRLVALPGIALGLAVTLTLVVAGALLAFVHPMGDDFCNGVNVREFGVLEGVIREYRYWGGRWGGHIITLAFPAAFELTRWYLLGPTLILGVNLLALWLLIGTVLRLGGNQRLAWVLTSIFFALYWSGMPHPGQSIYWLEGAYVYSLNLALSLVLVACLIRLPRRTSAGGRALASAVLALATLWVATFHELFALVLGGVLLTGAVVAFWLRDPRYSAWAACGAGALVGFVTVLLSPGNAVRQPTLHSEPNVVEAVSATLQMWLRVLDTPVSRDPFGSHTPLSWIVDVKLWSATLLFATAAPVRTLRPAWFEAAPRLWKAIVPAALLAILTGSFLSGGWALGRTLPLRAFNGLYLVFLLGWFLSVFVHTRWPIEPGRIHPGLRMLRVGSTLVLALSLLVSSNLKYGLRDLATGRAVAFDREMLRRYDAARGLRASGGGSLVLNRVEPWPSSYFQNDYEDVSSDLQDCLVRYFEVESVRVAGPPE